MALKDIGAGKIIARCHEYLVDLLFAPGTGRRGIYELAARSSHIIAEDGMQSFVERSQIYMRRKLSQKRIRPKSRLEKNWRICASNVRALSTGPRSA
jgi:hypothetical protein